MINSLMAFKILHLMNINLVPNILHLTNTYLIPHISNIVYNKYVPLIVALASIYISIGFWVYLYNYDHKHNLKGFKKDLEEMISTGRIEYPDLLHIAQKWDQARNSVLYNLQDLLTKSLKNESSLEGSTALIREFLRKLREEEPFAELPEDISTRLEEIQNILPTDKNKIEDLAKALNPLYLMNTKKISNNIKIGLFSSILTAVSILITFLTFI